jgi:hypothetical protein
MSEMASASNEPEPIWDSPYTKSGSRFRLIKLKGAVSVQFRRRTLLANDEDPAQGEYVSWDVLFYVPMGLNEIGRAVAQLCAIYDQELAQHIVPLLEQLSNLPAKILDASAPPQGNVILN